MSNRRSEHCFMLTTRLGAVLAVCMVGMGCSAVGGAYPSRTAAQDSGWTSSKWTFDEGRGQTARDVVSGRDDPIAFVFTQAYYKPSTAPYWQDGCISDGCLLFDGYSMSVDAPGLPSSIVDQGFTLSAWVAPHAFEWGDGGQYSAVLSQFDRDDKAGFVFGVYRHGTWGLKLGFGDQVIDFKVANRRLPIDEWSHVAVSYDPAGSVRLYLDGERVANLEVDARHRLAYAAQALRIGKHSQPHAIAGIFHLNTFLGLLDDVRIELGPLSDAEVGARVAEDLAPHAGSAPAVTRRMVVIPRSTFDGDRYRPQYHLLPHAHWMNEPHAPLYYGGQYHLFYQKNPHGPFWHQIHWGHWVSSDMVHWRELPIALRPEPDDLAPDGIWSGSATYDANGQPVLFFTAGHDGVFPKERTGLAVPANIDDPDLVRWEKYPTPVTVQKEGQGVWGQFRDPFVWKDPDRDRWYQLVTSGIPDGSGTALLFTSENLVDWRYHGPFFSTDIDEHPQVGTIWELPVFLPLGRASDGRRRYIFAFNAAGEFAVREVYYWIGTFDRETLIFTPDREAPQVFDFGGDHFTGPSGFVDPKTGTPVMFSIAQGERTPFGEYESGWAHNAGLPIKLWLGDDDRLRIAPIDALASLRKAELISMAGTTLAEANEALASIAGDELEVEVTMASDRGQVGISFRRTPDEHEKTDLTYDPDTNRLEIDRRRHSIDPDMRGREVDGGAIDLVDEPLKLRLFLDRSMVEAYVNDRKSITSRVFPARDDALGVALLGAPEVPIAKLKVWRMGSAYGPSVPVKPRGIGIDPKTAWQSDLPNHDFASCDLTGWNVTSGDAFDDRVVTSKDRFWRNIYFNPSFTIPGGCHLWGFFSWAGDSATGSMRTDTFVLGGDGRINFLIAGGDDIDRIYVALVRAATGEVLIKSTGSDYEEYRREYWDASGWIGEEVYLEVVDDATGTWGHINLDDIHVPFAPESARSSASEGTKS